MPALLSLSHVARSQAKSRATPVLLIPGFGGGDRVMAPFRKYLENAGYACFGWELGTNLAGLNQAYDDSELTWNIDTSRKNNGEYGVPYLCDRMTERVKQISTEVGNPVAIIGWSLGGCIAREVARDAPEQVEQVITLGTPVVGGPKYTAVADQLTKRGLDLDWIESEVNNRDSNPITRPITAIVSKSDGVVGYEAAIDRVSPNVNHIDVSVAHLGMVFNKQAWDLTLTALETGGC